MGNKFIPLGILVSVLVLLFVTKGLFVEVRDSNATLKAYNQDISSMSSTISELERIKATFAGQTQQVKIEKLKLAMPAAQQLPEVMVMVESMARKSAFKVSSFGISGSSGANEVGVNMAGKGTYGGLFNFTEMLEKNLRPIKIKSMSIGRGNANGSSITASVSMGLMYQGTYQQQVTPIEVK